MGNKATIKFNTKSLKDVLSYLTTSKEKNNGLNGVHFCLTNPNEILLTACDNSFQSQVVMNCEYTIDGEVGENPISFLLDKKVLKKTISTIHSVGYDEVTLIYDCKVNTGVLKAGKSKTKLEMLPNPDMFPFLKTDSLENGVAFNIRAVDLKKMMSHVSSAMGVQDIRPTLNGLCIHISNGELRLSTTNGHILSSDVLKTTIDVSQSYEIIVPRVTVVAMLDLLKVTQDDENVDFCISDKLFEIAFANGFVLTSPLIDGNFPVISRVMNGYYQNQSNSFQASSYIKFDVATLKQELMIALSSLSDDKRYRCIVGQVNKSNKTLELSLRENGKEIWSSDIEVIDIDDTRGYFDNVMNFNPYQFLGLSDIIATDEVVLMRVDNRSDSKISFFEVDNPNFEHVMMLMRD